MPTHTKALRSTVIAIAICLLLVQVAAGIFGVPAAIRGPSYFRTLYAAGSMVRTGQEHHLYNHGANALPQPGGLDQSASPVFTRRAFDRLAYEALLFAPFPLANYRTAYAAFFAVNLLLLLLSLWMLLPYFEKLPAVWSWFPAATFLCFFPVSLALIQGQDSILLLTLMIAAAASFYRHREFRSGIFLGMALSGNLPLTLPIALLFLLWRRWRIVIGFAIAAATAALVSLWLAGPSQFLASVRAAFSGFTAMSPMPAPPIAALGNLARYRGRLPNLRCLFETLSGPRWSPHAVLIAIVVCSVVMILWAGTRPPNFALAILVTLLASPQGSPIQDAVLLILPIGLVLDARITPVSKTHWWSRTIAVSLFVGPAVLFLLGWSYCVLSILMLALLITLRSTSTGYLDN